MAFDFLPRYAVCTPERVEVGPHAVPALLVRPDAPGPHPGALIQHGYGAEKTDLLPLGVFLAAYGFVSLLPDGWAHGERLPATGPTWKTEQSSDYFLTVIRHTLDDLRDALGVLADRPEVDADRMLAGGFSMGAMLALILGTEDERVAAVGALAGSPLPDLLGNSLFGGTTPCAELRDWAREHDAAAHVTSLAPKPLLISHGRADDMVPVAGALRLYEAATPAYAEHPDRLALRLYAHTHTVTQEQVEDAVSWIAPLLLSDDEASDSLAG
ncbi:MAG TPA: dienelactone hydrolase family protein [Ktedonobacterales bacterium]|nr:dienelactone hydrolase family protein [Ktedonobacterales bacterium]